VLSGSGRGAGPLRSATVPERRRRTAGGRFRFEDAGEEIVGPFKRAETARAVSLLHAPFDAVVDHRSYYVNRPPRDKELPRCAVALPAVARERA
jgi:hypothetical protein